MSTDSILPDHSFEGDCCTITAYPLKYVIMRVLPVLCTIACCNAANAKLGLAIAAIWLACSCQGCKLALPFCSGGDAPKARVSAAAEFAIDGLQPFPLCRWYAGPRFGCCCCQVLH